VNPIASPERLQTAQLLILLRQYVTDQVRQYPFLLSSVPALREAAKAFGRNDLRQAFQNGVDVYQFLMRSRAANPGMPLP
jgi:hypothetical protein